MKFIQMHDLLRQELIDRIDRGVLSVSLLARQTRLAQAHISNFLHNRRRLSLSALDRVLTAQRLEAENLLPTSSGWRGKHPLDEKVVDIPIVSHRTAIADPVIYASSVLALLPLPAATLEPIRYRAVKNRLPWQRFVAVRIPAGDTPSMEPVLLPDAIVVIDRHYNSFAPFDRDKPSLYAIAAGPKLLVRYVKYESEMLILTSRNSPWTPETIPIEPGQRPQDLIVGRVVLVQNAM